MYTQHNTPHTKKSANLSINADLLKEARLLHINLSQTLEERLNELIQKARANQWLNDNRLAIDEYNKRIEQEGLFSDGIRRI